MARDVPMERLTSPAFGSNFVDLGIKVVVQGAQGTLTAFQPNHLHGTTYCDGVTSYGVSMTATRRVRDAIQDLMDRGHTVFDYLDTDKHMMPDGYDASDE